MNVRDAQSCILLKPLNLRLIENITPRCIKISFAPLNAETLN